MNSPIKWVGGKSKSVQKILPLFPEHNKYVEMFCGASWLLFKKEKSDKEVINDFDNNLMNFYKVIKDQPQEFIDSFDFMLVSRELFNNYKEIYKKGIFKNDIHHAHIFYYLNRICFGADMMYPSFGTGKRRNGLKLEDFEQSIWESNERLKNVVLENQSFETIFGRYDKEDTFFFIDSPYRNTKQYATGKFEDKQYELLHDCCEKAKGKWLYTINNDDFIKDLFKDFYIYEHNVNYSVSKTTRDSFSELIITNFELKNDNKEIKRVQLIKRMQKYK